MGGHILVGIRRKDGTEIISERWTNPLPYWLGRPDFWKGGKVVDSYLKQGLESFKPCKTIFPSSYGVLLIDFQTKRVCSLQGYTKVWTRLSGSIDKEDAKYFLQLIDKGWVYRYECWRRGGHFVEDDKKDADLSSAEKILFRKYLETVRDLPDDEKTWVKYKHFSPGMVIAHFKVPGWSLEDWDDDDIPARWDLVRGFLKDNDWKSPVWSTKRVAKDYED